MKNDLFCQSAPTCDTTGWWALYIRLSREDGDKAESLSVAHQRMKLMDAIRRIAPDVSYKWYIDDGWSGTHFDRPAFRELLQDIEAKHVFGILLKDLSRLGRNNQKTSYFVQEYFPLHRVRLVAIDDHIDKSYYEVDSSRDMMIDIKNMFNGFYPRDISCKVRSTFRTKQHAGQFIGAFACYGYRKAPDDHNRLLIDPPAAAIVQRIFSLYLDGNSLLSIAGILNEEQIPCPSVYKRLLGLNYHNSQRLDSTTYWTYSSVRNILRNPIYTGSMVQNRTVRQLCQKRASALPPEQWIRVPNTHEAVIDPAAFEKVQNLLASHARQTRRTQPVHPFAGLLKCADCGRSLIKVKRRGKSCFCCGSYHRYGTNCCSAHYLEESVLYALIQKEINRLIQRIPDCSGLVRQEIASQLLLSQNQDSTIALSDQVDRLLYKKKKAYEDYSDGILSREEYLQYKCDTNKKIEALHQTMQTFSQKDNGFDQIPWIHEFLKTPPKILPDRLLVTGLIRRITVSEDRVLQIEYTFQEESTSHR